MIRNAGNIVPTHALNGGGNTASIEFAVAALGVKHIVVCGHSDCGAMKGAINPAGLTELPQVQSWLNHSRAAVETVKAKYGQATIDELPQITEENIRLQLQHLRTHPAVAVESSPAARSTCTAGSMTSATAASAAYDEDSDSFVDLEQRYADLL